MYNFAGDGEILNNGAPIYAPECIFDACYMTEDLSYVNFPLPTITEGCDYVLTASDVVTDGGCGAKNVIELM